MIGHSFGPAFILNILERINNPIKSCYFVSGFIGLLNNKEFDDINKTFVDKILTGRK
jgi:predicted alpha/beta hydrolase family esterase